MKIIISAQQAVNNDLALLKEQQKAVTGGTNLPLGSSKGTKGVTSSGTSYTVKD
jgi:hypothetical protein